MAAKSRPKKSATKAAAKGKIAAPKGKLGMAVGAAKAVGGFMGLVGGGKGKGKGGRRSKKKSAFWYAKEIQRMKLKRKYLKEKFKV